MTSGLRRCAFAFDTPPIGAERLQATPPGRRKDQNLHGRHSKKESKMKVSARKSLAYHEAGHLVAAFDQGIRVLWATIVPTESYYGSVQPVGRIVPRDPRNFNGCSSRKRSSVCLPDRWLSKCSWDEMSE